MALVSRPAVTKRLSFDVAVPSAQTDLDEGLRFGTENPNAEALASAVDSLRAMVTEHFREVETAALAKTDEVGEADLRRLKRQFGSLKNSFLHFEVKESFITSLMDGLPNGTEAEQLSGFEEEVASIVGQLRSVKAANKDTMSEIEGLIDETCAGQVQLLSQLSDIGALVADVAAAECADARSGVDVTEDDDLNGATVDSGLVADLAAGTENVRVLEAELAEIGSRIEDVQVASEGLRAQLAELALRSTEAPTVDGQGPKSSAPSDASTEQELAEWAQMAAELCSTLTGVSITRFNADGVDLSIRSSFPTSVLSGAAALDGAACDAAVHGARVWLQPGTALVESVELSPPDVPLAAHTFKGLALPDAVHYLTSVIAGHKHRAALLSSCLAASTTDPSLQHASLSLGKAQTAVAVSLEQTWPATSVDCMVVEGQPPERFKGMSLVQIAAQLTPTA